MVVNAGAQWRCASSCNSCLGGVIPRRPPSSPPLVRREATRSPDMTLVQRPALGMVFRRIRDRIHINSDTHAAAFLAE